MGLIKEKIYCNVHGWQSQIVPDNVVITQCPIDPADSVVLDSVSTDSSSIGVSVLASNAILNTSLTVPSGGWSFLGQATTDPSFFDLTLEDLLGRVVAVIKTTGSGALLRITEQSPSNPLVDLTPAPYLVPDTSGAWTPISFSTSIFMRSGQNEYTLEGDSGTAASFEIRHASVTLLELD